MKKRFIFTSLFLLLIFGTQSALAQSDDVAGEMIYDDIVLFGENLTIETDSTVKGDVVVFGGDAMISGFVDGDLVIFGGHVELENEVTGDIVVFGGDIVGLEGALTGGDCMLMGGATSGDLGCTAVSGSPDFFANFDEFEQFVDSFDEEGGFAEGFDIQYDDNPSIAGTLIGSFFLALIAGAIAYGVTSAAPDHLRRAEDVVSQKLVVSGVVGGLTAVSVPALISIGFGISSLLILACGIGLLGYPVLLAMGLIYGAGAVFGWVVLGRLGAERFGLMQHRSLAAQAAVGTVLLTFVVNGLDIIPAIGSIISMVVFSVGLGATVLTRFGTRTYGLPSGRVVEDAILIDPDKESKVIDTLVDDPNDFK